MKSTFFFISVFLTILIFVGCASKFDDAKELAESKKFDLAIAKLQEVPPSDQKWQEAQDLIKGYRKERDKQLLSQALSLAKQTKIKESLSIMRKIVNLDLQRDIYEIELAIGKDIIQGSWEQIESGMGYTRIIRFDDGIFSAVDGFSNSNYRGAYEISGVSDNGDLLTLGAQCNVKFGYQNFTIYLTIQFTDLNRISVEGNWAPPSNGTYGRLNR